MTKYHILIVVSIIVTFFLFQPRILNFSSSYMRARYLNQLIQATKDQNHLNSQYFWETREFYYPGVFYVFEDGLAQDRIDSTINRLQINLNNVENFPILVYDSKKWASFEALVNTTELNDLIPKLEGEIIYLDQNSKIIKNKNKLYIFFLKPYEELKTTNGFIYTKEKILSKYSYWFGASEITE